MLAREHRAHHVDPRNIPLIFIPWKSLLWVLPLTVAIALLAFPRLGMGVTYLVFIAALGIGYEWTHYLIHSDYKPKSRFYRAVWRNHRQHHYKNEHYWFTVTSSGTADRVLRHVSRSGTTADLTDREEPARQPGVASSATSDDDRITDTDHVEIPCRVVGTEVDAAVADVRIAL